MDEMIARIAKALAAADHKQLGFPPPETLVEKEVDAYYMRARAAIDAMQEPTDAMVHAGAAALDHPSVYMGGPSFGNKRAFRKAYEASIAMALES